PDGVPRRAYGRRSAAVPAQTPRRRALPPVPAPPCQLVPPAGVPRRGVRSSCVERPPVSPEERPAFGRVELRGERQRAYLRGARPDEHGGPRAGRGSWVTDRLC